MNREHTKQSSIQSIALQPGRVDLWYTACNRVDQRLLEAYWELLSPDETERAQRFHFDRDRHLYLTAHAMLRTVLSRYSPVEPQRWEFETEGNGKPRVAKPPAAEQTLQFNLSHTRGLAVCAVTCERRIGVDVESLSRQPNILGLAKRYFAPSESANVAALPEDRRHGRFFEYWTLKESYIKAIGTGLATPLDRFSFDLDAQGPPGIAFIEGVEDEPADWQFAQFCIGAGFQGALAIQAAPAPLTVAAAETVPLAESGQPQILPANSDHRWTL